MLQAILHGRSETSKLSTLLAPLSPARRRRQLVSTPQPSGVTIPTPVMTTRLISDLSGRDNRAANPPDQSAGQSRRADTWFYLFQPAGRQEIGGGSLRYEPAWRPLVDDGTAGRQAGSAAFSLGQLLAFFSRNFTASPTVRIVSAASSGISQPNSSSNAITSSTVSRLSAPRSSMKLALSVTFSGSTPRCSTTIFFTRSAMSLIV